MNLAETIHLVTSGGPAVVLAVVWWLGRKDLAESRARNQVLEDKVLQLATAQTEAISKLGPTLNTIQTLLTQLVGRG